MYLYDDIGTALFEVITLLPEYGLTRADARLLRSNAAEMAGRLPSALIVTELGSGTGAKTRWVLQAVARDRPVAYYPIDVSASALLKCGQELGHLEGSSIHPLEASYLDGLKAVVSLRRPGEGLLLLFLGSTIGNFDPVEGEQFLTEIRSHLMPGDALLLGTDLVKPVPQLLRAYDDALGVTAAFNLNVLARINRELGGNFMLHRFRHEVRYDESACRVEMHLRSTIRQTASIPGAGCECSLQKGETIWTESSHKFHAETIPVMARRTGFCCEEQWIDEDWLFAESLLIACS